MTVLDDPAWQKMTNIFGPCHRCKQPNRPLFPYRTEDGHFDVDQPWTDEPLCNVDPENGDCCWCDRPKGEPWMLCPPCFGATAAEEREALDAVLIERGLLLPEKGARHGRP